MRTAIVAVMAIALGAVCGALVVRAQFAGQLADFEGEADNLRAELQQLRQEHAAAQEEAARLDALNQRSATEKGLLQEQMASLDASGGEAQPFVLQVEVQGDLAQTRPPGDRREDRAGRDRGDRGPWGGSPEAREEFRAQMRERFGEFYASQIEQATDPGAKDRLASMAEYSQLMMDLHQQMRDSDDEEERDALHQSMDDAQDAYRALAAEQKDYMTRELAKTYGITDRAKQDAFIASMEELQSNPLIRMGGGPGGPGGWGGGRGGRGGR